VTAAGNITNRCAQRVLTLTGEYAKSVSATSAAAADLQRAMTGNLPSVDERALHAAARLASDEMESRRRQLEEHISSHGQTTVWE
jgi:hypothetical protein